MYLIETELQNNSKFKQKYMRTGGAHCPSMGYISVNTTLIKRTPSDYEAL